MTQPLLTRSALAEDIAALGVCEGDVVMAMPRSGASARCSTARTH